MRTAIVGAGAMGSVFGARLALAGHDVTLIDPRADHIEAVRRDGLELRGGAEGSRRVALAATTDAAEVAPVELAIVLTKSFATEAAGRSMRPALSDRTWVVTLQNGLGNDRRLAAVLGPERVVPGTTTVGAEQERPGTTRMSASTARGESMTHLGRPRSLASMPREVRDIADVLGRAGLPAEASDSSDELIWAKVAMAAPMGALSALLGRTVIETWEGAESRRALFAMVDEVLAVAAACGVPLERDSIRERCESTFPALGPHRSSMAADLIARRRTEIDALCLEVARLAAEHGVRAPLNRTVGLAVKAVETSYASG